MLVGTGVRGEPLSSKLRLYRSRVRLAARRKAAITGSVPRMLTTKLHLAVVVFAGSGHLGTALASAGFQVVMWDVELSSSHDLLIAHNRLCLMRVLGACKFAHFSLPHATYLGTGRASNGVNAVRTASHLRGIPFLSAADAVLVHNADVLTSFSVKCINRLRSRGIACTVENPHYSLLWRLPSFRSYLLHPEVVYVRTSFCMFGARWKKQTGLLSIHFPLVRELESHRGAGACSELARLVLQQILWNKVSERRWLYSF
jgi:hypothetical protein